MNFTENGCQTALNYAGSDSYRFAVRPLALGDGPEPRGILYVRKNAYEQQAPISLPGMRGAPRGKDHKKKETIRCM
jgi:hypothetical protein